ncbi:MAG: hypothetical protein U9Q15_03820 [Patescibacteria group bacterium]|nr:hypothetical protein [Patescibacteria group bacterium]
MNELRENSEFLKNYNSKAGKFIDIVRKHNIYYGAAILGLSHYDPSDGFMSEENIEKYNDLGLFDEGAKERYDAIYEKKRSNSG